MPLLKTKDGQLIAYSRGSGQLKIYTVELKEQVVLTPEIAEEIIADIEKNPPRRTDPAI